MRKILLVIGFMLCFFCLNFTYAKDQTIGKVKIRLASIPERKAATVAEKAELAVLDEFLRRNPDIGFEATSGISLPVELTDGNFFMAMAGGTAPDVLRIYLRNVQVYIDQGFAIPLNGMDKEWRDKQDIPEILWPVLRRDGKYYAAIESYYVMGLIFRKDFFLEAGLPPRAPKDWDEFYYFAQKLILSGKGAFAILSGSSSSWVWQNYVWQAGGEIVRHSKICPGCGTKNGSISEEDIIKCQKCGEDISKEKEKWEVTYHEQPGVEALNYYKKLRWSKWIKRPEDGEPIDIETIDIKTGKRIVNQEILSRYNIEALEKEGKVYTGVVRMSPNFEEAQLDLFKGKLAMCISMPTEELFLTALSAGLRPDQIGFGNLPAGPKGKKANFIGGMAYGVNATQKDPKVRDAAWEYINFFISDDAKKISTKVFMDYGMPEYVTPKYLKKFGYMEAYESVPQERREVYEEIEKFGRLEPYCPGYQIVCTSFMPVPIGKILIDPNADVKEELFKSAEQANEKAMKMLPEPIMEKRRLYGWIITSIAMIGVVFSFIKVMLGLKEKYRINIGGSAKRVSKRKHVIAWTLMLPALIIVLMWQYIPLIWGSIMAFFDYKLLGGGKYIGIDNFITALFDSMFYYVILITIYYVLLSISIGFTAPIALAWFLSEVPRGKILYRTIFYLPTVTTGLIIMFLWKDLFFNPTSQGLLNKIVGLLGIPHQTWLEDPRLAMLCIILPGIWAGTGSASILYLAALKTVPDELYESADIDGASTWQKIYNITIPTLKPLIIITFVGAFIGAFHAMQNIFVMTGGGPMNATRTIGMEIWINAFLFLKFGYATAMAWVLGAALIGFTVYQLQILKKIEFTTVSAEGKTKKV